MDIKAILKKLTSRKFLLAAVGGIVTALGSIMSYNAAESKVDAAAVEKEGK